MKFNFLVFFFHLSFSLLSQKFPSELWHEGWLVTNDKDTLKGNLKYDFEAQLIQIKIDDKIKAYSNRNIYYFEIYDKTIEDYRQFYSLMYEVNYNYKIPILFEVLIEGELSLLLKEKIVSETIPRYFPSYYWYGRKSYEYYNKIDYEFFFMRLDGTIIKFNGKKKDLFNIMYEKINDIKLYFIDNNLKIKKMSDLVKIVSYYNSLS